MSLLRTEIPYMQCSVAYNCIKLAPICILCMVFVNSCIDSFVPLFYVLSHYLALPMFVKIRG